MPRPTAIGRLVAGAGAGTVCPTITRGLNWNPPAAAASNPGSLALSILNAGYLLDVELSAMQQESRGEVISNPRVVTTNQREAMIKQGKEIGYVTISGGTAGGVATPNVQFKRSGAGAEGHPRPSPTTTACSSTCR